MTASTLETLNDFYQVPTITLTYYWDDWLGESEETLEETFMLSAGQTKVIDWYDYASPESKEEYF